MAGKLDLGDLTYKLGFDNEAQFLAALNGVFKDAESKAGAAGKRAGSSFADDFKGSLGTITAGAFLGTTLASAFTGAISAAKEFGQQSVKEFASYEQGLIQLSLAGEKNLGAVEERIKSLSDASKVFSVTEISSAIGELVKQGASVDRAFELVSQGVKLASSDVDAATGSFGNLSTSSVQLGNVLEALKLETAQTANVTDVLAKAAQESGLTVQELVDIVVRAGPGASTAGIGLNDLAAAAAVLSKNGLDASTIGSGLRGVIETLKSPTKETAAEFERYGLNIIKADGTTRKFSEVLANLERVVQSGGRGAQFISKSFDSFQSSVVTGLGQSGTAINSFATSLEDAEGSAQTLSDTITNSTLGSLANIARETANARKELGEQLAPVMRDFYTSILPLLVSGFGGLVTVLREVALAFGLVEDVGERSKLSKLETERNALARIATDLKKRIQDGSVTPLGVDIFGQKALLADLEKRIATLDRQIANVQLRQGGQGNLSGGAPPVSGSKPPAPPVKPTSNAPIGGAPAKEGIPSATAVQALLPQARALAVALEAANKSGNTAGIIAATQAIKKFEDGNKTAAAAMQFANGELARQKKAFDDNKRALEELNKAKVAFEAGLAQGKFSSALSGKSSTQLEAIIAEQKAAQDKAAADIRSATTTDAVTAAQGRYATATTQLGLAQSELQRRVGLANRALEAQQQAAGDTALKVAQASRALYDGFDPSATQNRVSGGVASALEQSLGVDANSGLLRISDSLKRVQTQLDQAAAAPALFDAADIKSLEDAKTRLEAARDAALAFNDAIGTADAQERAIQANDTVVLTVEAMRAALETSGATIEDVEAQIDALNDLLENTPGITAKTRAAIVLLIADLEKFKDASVNAAAAIRDTTLAVQEAEQGIATALGSSEGKTLAENLIGDSRLFSEDLQQLIDLEQDILDLRQSDSDLGKENILLLDQVLERLRLRKQILEATPATPITPFDSNPSLPPAPTTPVLDQPKLTPKITPSQRANLEAISTPKLTALQSALEALNAEFENGAIEPGVYLDRIGALQAVADELSPTLTLLGINQTGLIDAIDAGNANIETASQRLQDLEDDANSASEAQGELARNTEVFANAAEAATAEVAFLNRVLEINNLNGLSVVGSLNAQIAELDRLLLTVEANSDAWLIYARARASALASKATFESKDGKDEAKDIKQLTNELQNVGQSFVNTIVGGLSSGDISGALTKSLGDVASFFLGKLVEGLLGEVAAAAAAAFAAKAGGEAAGSALGGAAGALGAFGPVGAAIGIGVGLLSLIIPALTPQPAKANSSDLFKGRDQSSSAITYNAIANVEFSSATDFKDPAFRAMWRGETTLIVRDLLEQLGLISKRSV